MKPATKSAIVVVIIVLIGAGAFVLSRENSTDTKSSTSKQEVSEEQSSTPKDNNTEKTADSQQTESITTAQVALHSAEEDCWTIIDGSVYDITSYVPRHPGGEEILRACGTDGTSLFEQRTTENGEEVGSGSPHSSNASKQLASLKIGDLAD